MNKTIKTAATTVFTNQSLSTASLAASVLTDLKDRDGNSIDIKSSDTIKVSFVQNGKTVTTSYAVSNTTLASVFAKATAAASTTGYGFNGTLQAGGGRSLRLMQLVLAHTRPMERVRFKLWQQALVQRGKFPVLVSAFREQTAM